MMLRFVLVLAPFLLATPLPQQHAPPPDPDGFAMEVDHFIFFAVLEGLFADGVEDAIVKKVLEIDDKVPDNHANFVYACPICRPTIEAFRAHRVRSEFSYGRKGDMIGDSKLPADQAKAILEGSPEARRAALQTMLSKFIRRRMDLMRLTADERDKWNAVLQRRRESGMASLKSWKLPWKECPSCEAAVSGSKK